MLNTLLNVGVIGDATTSDIAILSLVSMVGGYALLAGLWYFVFRDKSRDKGDR